MMFLCFSVHDIAKGDAIPRLVIEKKPTTLSHVHNQKHSSKCLPYFSTLLFQAVLNFSTSSFERFGFFFLKNASCCIGDREAYLFGAGRVEEWGLSSVCYLREEAAFLLAALDC